MKEIINFLENQTVGVWLAPLIIAAIIGVWNVIIKKITGSRNNSIFTTKRNRTVQVFNKFCEKNRIEPMVSYGDKNAIKVISEIDRGIVKVKADIDTSNKPESDDNNFVMILMKFIPGCDMSYFYRKGYRFKFDIKSEGGISGVQLEIKGRNLDKIIDEYIEVTDVVKQHSYKLNEYSNEEVWKEIKEICFTIFTNNCYIENDTGSIEIHNCILERDK